MAGQGALLGQHEQVLQIMSHNVAAFMQSMQDLTQNLARLANPPAPSGATSAAASYTYDPEPCDGNLDWCRGFLLQYRLVFSQCSQLFASDAAKFNYIIGLLRGKALVWAQASNSSGQLSTLTINKSVKRFEWIFEQPNKAGAHLTGSSPCVRAPGQWQNTRWSLTP